MTGADRAEDIRRLVADATQADGTSPLNEQALIDLDSDDVEHRIVADAQGVVAYAQYAPDTRTAQLVVAPRMRHRGHGRDLARAVVREHPGAMFWSFGHLDAAAALATELGYVAGRRLDIMARDFTEHPPQEVEPPAGYVIRPYTDADAEAWLALNSRAFSGHPEQGTITKADLDDRTAEGWFDAEGFLLAQAPGGELAGFHWTKRHPGDRGEVYVIGVSPDAGGLGLGHALLEAGLSYLASTGCKEAILYVDGDNARAHAMYERSGFAVVHSDVCYERREGTS